MLRCSTLVALVFLLWTGVARTQDAPAAAPQPFEAWLAELRAEALTRGIRPEVLDAAFADDSAGRADSRTRSHPGGVRARSHGVSQAPAHAPRGPDRAADAHRSITTCSSAVGKKYGVQPRDHHRRLGARIELRALRRRASDDPGARHPRLRSAPRDALPQGALQRARDRQSRRHRARTPARDRGPAPSASRSSCPRPISSSRRTSTATADEISGARRPMCLPRSPTT